MLVSGGKDSAFTLEFLRESGIACARCSSIRPRPRATSPGWPGAIARSSWTGRSIPRCSRSIASGYLNGHTPFSAYLAFLGAPCAVVYGHRHVMVSNERSCDEPAAHYLGGDVIHQYSKTYRFEELAAAYVRRHLAGDAHFWSLLRPLYELQVVKLFSTYPRQFPRLPQLQPRLEDNAWCGQLREVPAIFTALYPFVPGRRSAGSSARTCSRGPTWCRSRGARRAHGDAPLECVGAIDETLAGFHLSLEKVLGMGRPLPPVLAWFADEEAPRHPELAATAARILGNWSDRHGLPREYADALRARLTAS